MCGDNLGFGIFGLVEPDWAARARDFYNTETRLCTPHIPYPIPPPPPPIVVDTLNYVALYIVPVVHIIEKYLYFFCTAASKIFSTVQYNKCLPRMHAL